MIVGITEVLLFLVIVWGFFQDANYERLKEKVSKLEDTKETYGRVWADSYDKYYARRPR